MAKAKTSTSSTAVAEPKMTAAEVLRRREVVLQEEREDREFYASAVQRLARGESDDVERTAVEMLAEEFGFSLASDLDRLRKLFDWAKNGLIAAGSAEFDKQLDALQKQQAEQLVDLEEARATVKRLEAAYQDATIAANKFSTRGHEINRYRAAMGHVFQVEGATE
jgi:hypothetical protein